MGKEAIVSRGELIEIGGSFRIPEVMAASGATLHEVGTTNRTRFQDYARAIGPRTGLILKVHPSNFEISGFTEEASLEDLVALGKERGLPVVFDLGSGYLLPEGTLDVGGEPSVRTALKTGADVVCFSADKLMGASQGGLLLVAPKHVHAFRSNHLLRALRVDKLSYFLLGKAVETYRRGRWEEIPGLRMLEAPIGALRRRASGLLRRIETKIPGRFWLEVVLEEGRVGAGSAPTHGIPSPALAVRPVRGSVTNLDGYLRREGSPAVMGVVAEDRLLLHMRTVLPGQVKALEERLEGYPEWHENRGSTPS
jgi:L-seryl-tRNA(Ser) seleniumtransferase